MSFNMYIPTRILFRVGELNNLHIQKMPGKKAMVFISKGKSARSNGYLARTEEQLKLAGIETVVFDKVEANPLRSTVMAGAVSAKENGCDFVVALGGGSCIDAAKAIAVMAANDGDYWDYVFGGIGKGKAMEHKPLPVIAITTTAGTGSETDPWAVVTHEENHEKIGLGNDDMFPVLAVVDPERVIFPKGGKFTDGHFIGAVWVEPLVPMDSTFNCMIANVTFEPGARNNWHKHPGGQILLVTGGKGYFQEEGKPAQAIQEGDVVKIYPNVKHWHGATPDSWLVHVAIITNPQKGDAVWLEPVTDKEYNNLR